MEDKKYILLFQNLFDEYFRPLVLFAYHYVNDWQAGEDIVQDVFMSLWNKREEVDFEHSIKPYLYRSAYNKSLNYLNSVLIRYRIDQPENIDALIDQEILSYNQHDTLLLHELSEEIDSFVEKMPEQRKKVYRMSRQQNLKNKEIAIRLNISEKAVEKHITKALADIRTHLQEAGMMSGLFCVLLSSL